MTEPESQTLSEEEFEQLLFNYKHDYLFFAPRVLKVVAMEGKIVEFFLNGPQRILHRAVASIEGKKRLVRIFALKARRMGFSTYFSGRYYHRVSWNFNRFASQVTHEPEATETLFGMVKRFYDLSPEILRPTTRYNNSRLLDFNTKDGKGLNSGFRVATAAKEDFGSSQLIHYFHGSEMAKWPAENIDSLLTSVLQCVPDEPDTEVAFESTAKGIGGEFYDGFWGARFRIWVKKMNRPSKDYFYGKKGHKYDQDRAADEISKAAVVEETVNESANKENLYTSIFLPWFCFEKYQMDYPSDLEEDLAVEGSELAARYGDEVEIMEAYGLTLPQMYWRRVTIDNKCNGSLDKFNQEYPDCPENAFLASGRPVFDNQTLLRLKDTLPKPEARYDFNFGTKQFYARADGLLKVWREPKWGRSYIISADVAEGLAKGDFSSADVIDHATGKQIGHWHGHVRPDQFAIILYYLGMRYNKALLAPERNNNGLLVVQRLVDMEYPNLYVELIPEPPGKPRKRYGWVTTSATRPLIIGNLAGEVGEGTTGIQCAETIEEMMAFKHQENGKMEADSNRHDDRVISIAIGKHLRSTMPVPIFRETNILKADRKRGRKKPPVKGWT